MNADHRSAISPVIIRRARGDDAAAAAELFTALGYPSEPAQVARRMADFAGVAGAAVFVAECAGGVVGVLSFHCIPMFHLGGFLGRITSLVVATEYRRRGIGRLLVAAGEEFGWANGCSSIEVTSRNHRREAHAFYERLGYEGDSRRFIKRASGT